MSYICNVRGSSDRMLNLQGTFLKPAPKILQKLEEAKHNLLEIKEWETCMEKEHPKKKEV